MVDRHTPIPWGKKGGPLRGKTLAQLETKSVQYVADKASEVVWHDAGLAELAFRESGAAGAEPTTPMGGGAPEAPAPSYGGGGPGYPGSEAPPTDYNIGKERRWDVLPLPPGPDGLAAKHYADTLVQTFHYMMASLERLGHGDAPALYTIAEKLAVSACISSTERGIDLLKELQDSGQLPGPKGTRNAHGDPRAA